MAMSKEKDSDVFIHAKIMLRSDRRCPMTIRDRIEINPKVMMGKPVIRGTRLTVELILRKLSEGATQRDLLEAYPKLTREDIHAAIRFDPTRFQFYSNSSAI
jgi:uncharacterized protein (DUF433 family)